MNVFKKSLFWLLLFVGSYSCFAQEISIRGGLNLSQMLEKSNGTVITEGSKLNPGFHFGPIIDLPMNNFLSFETGILYTVKGLRRKGDPIPNHKRFFWELNIAYLDVPFTIKAYMPINNVTLFCFGGGYLATGLNGDMIYKEDIKDTNGSWRKVIWGSEGESFNRIDYGLNVGLGIRYNSFQLGFCYERGLANIVGPTNSTGILHNRVAEVYLTYLLTKNK